MNVLIVEGKEDKAFLEYLLDIENITDVTIAEPPKVNIAELGGLSKEALNKQIGRFIPQMKRGKIEKVGLVVDLDTLESGGGYEKRLTLINLSIQESFKNLDIDISAIGELSKKNQVIKLLIDDNEVLITFFFIHLNGKGELEDLLREIKIHDSHHADCLEAWRKCLKLKNIEKSDKEINKLWLHYYIRYDICTQDEQEHAGKYCNLKHVLNDEARKETLFNFQHKCLDELKEFLRLFKAKMVVLE
ncbi:MAG: hypothetical protein KAU26_02350 [Methylococcales bacterium]|nr:hypothetical protein [Methylococcales bacterium]